MRWTGMEASAPVSPFLPPSPDKGNAMARIEHTMRTAYRAPTKGRSYLSARSAAHAEARAMLGEKYPSEEAEYESSGRMTYPGYHWGQDERLVRVHKRLARLILRQLRRSSQAATDKKEM